MKKDRSITKNYLYNVSYKILTLITPLITTPYIARVLGVDNVGIYNYTYSIISYFVLFGVLIFFMMIKSFGFMMAGHTVNSYA